MRNGIGPVFIIDKQQPPFLMLYLKHRKEVVVKQAYLLSEIYSARPEHRPKPVARFGSPKWACSKIASTSSLHPSSAVRSSVCRLFCKRKLFLLCGSEWFGWGIGQALILVAYWSNHKLVPLSKIGAKPIHSSVTASRIAPKLPKCRS